MSTEPERQRIVRVAGSRRVKLTPAPGTTTEPSDDVEGEASTTPSRGPNDEQLLRDVPPHY